MSITSVQSLNGIITINPNSSSPVSYNEGDVNRFSEEVNKWVINGGVIEELQPSEELSAKQIRDEALKNITWTRPSDGVEVQIRHPDYAADYLLMEKAKDRLLSGESRNWIDKHDNPITLTKEDMEQCLAYGDEQIESIYGEYIATL